MLSCCVCGGSWRKLAVNYMHGSAFGVVTVIDLPAVCKTGGRHQNQMGAPIVPLMGSEPSKLAQVGTVVRAYLRQGDRIGGGGERVLMHPVFKNERNYTGRRFGRPKVG